MTNTLLFDFPNTEPEKHSLHPSAGFVLPENREKILIGGEMVDLLDLVAISDDLDTEMKTVNHYYATIHEILVHIDDQVGQLVSERKRLEDELDYTKARLTESYRDQKAAGDKSLTVDMIKAKVEADIAVTSARGRIRDHEMVIGGLQFRTKRLRGYMEALVGKREMLLVLGSNKSRTMLSGDTTIKSR